jgi:transcriptional regulator of NAD metabolism
MGKILRHTHHAVHRRAQRNLTERDVQFVLEHGRRIRCGGVLHVFLGKRDIPDDQETRRQFERLEGTTLVINETDYDHLVLITTYRNRRALKQIRSKPRYERVA